MAVAWSAYDSFAWSKAKQGPMDELQKAAIVEWAAEILELTVADRHELWGHASPPGRYAATVIRVAPFVAHRFRAQRAHAQIEEIGIKVFKTTADAQNQARAAVEFHSGEVSRLPGLPNPHVQRSLTAGLRSDGHGVRRGYIVQEWVRGTSLEDCLRIRWLAEPIDGTLACALIEQLFAGIIIPLWQAGTIWWDIRDANFCYCEESGRLRMIDVDSLDAYARDILNAGGGWDAREKGRKTALARLRRMCVRLLCATRSRSKTMVENGIGAAWSAILEPELRRLGREPGQDQVCLTALERFVGALEQARVLSPQP